MQRQNRHDLTLQSAWYWKNYLKIWCSIGLATALSFPYCRSEPILTVEATRNRFTLWISQQRQRRLRYETIVSKLEAIKKYISGQVPDFYCIGMLHNFVEGTHIQWFFWGVFHDHRHFWAFFAAIWQDRLGCVTPLWPNQRPKIWQRDATMAGKYRQIYVPWRHIA